MDLNLTETVKSYRNFIIQLDYIVQLLDSKALKKAKIKKFGKVSNLELQLIYCIISIHWK